jgi:hypothetical protein
MLGSQAPVEVDEALLGEELGLLLGETLGLVAGTRAGVQVMKRN